MQDLRLALRQLGKSPGFSTTVIVTLALGIGACTAMFSIVNTALLNPPNRVPEPDRVVLCSESRRADRPDTPTSVANFLDWKRMATSFEAITVTMPGRASLVGGIEPLPLVLEMHAEDSQAVVHRPVQLGRWFQPEEYTPGKDKIAVLRHEFWQQAFGGDPGVISRTIVLNAATANLVLNDEVFTVIGVTAPNLGGQPSDVMLPLVFSDRMRAERGRRNAWAMARLKPGVSLADAQAEMDVISAQLAQQYPETNQDWRVSLVSLSTFVWERRGRTLTMMAAAVACVLLIACANVANLQLVRATTRQREISVRAALGASRPRLFRQLLTESLVLALLGGVAGVLLAHWALAAFNVAAPAVVRRNLLFEVDATILGFALALSLGTGLLVGVLPAWIASRANLNSALKQAGRGSTEGGRGAWLRSGMAAGQVACAVVLLAGAGLFLRSFTRLVNVDPGFAPQHAIGLRLFSLSARRYPTNEHCNAFVEDVLARMRTLPGVQAAGAALQLPVNDSRPAPRGFAVDEAQAAQPQVTWPTAAYYTASTDYFRAAGFRILRGRAFTAGDHATAQRVVIINETLARRHFAGRDPIGRTIWLAPMSQEAQFATGYDGPRVIVGVVSDIKQDGLDKDSMCQVYEPNTQGLFVGTNFVVRHTGDPAALIPLLKEQVYAVDRNQPITAVLPLQEMFDANIGTQRFIMQLVSIFSAIALTIAAVGIYGVMAYSVGRRTTEIGIRMALGATSDNVLRHVLGGGLRIVAAGLVLGLAATLALSQLIASMLFQTSPRDPLALAAITLVLAVVALLACWLPARRATRVSPLEALRAE